MKEVSINKKGEELAVTLTGEIDSTNADEFYGAVIGVFEENPKDVHFICDRLTFIDSTTLGVFVKLFKHVRAAGKNMRLSGLQPKIKKLFTICALDKIMEIDG